MKKSILFFYVLFSVSSLLAYSNNAAPLAAISADGSGNWSDPTNWSNNQLPGINDAVTIPDGFDIVLDMDVDVRSLVINGTLTADMSKDLALSAEYIIVYGPGSKLEWGTESNPYLRKGTITLKGLEDGNNHYNMGDKFLVGMNQANIELHGKPKKSWTKIDQTANRGDNYIWLSEPVDWEVGDEIVIASTDFDPHEAEKRTIIAIDGYQRGITLDCPLAYKHWGTLQSFDGGSRTLDERAEVGLLTRNLKIQGDADSEIDQFGGHMMTMITSVTHVSGVELYRMGQLRALGRYPFHWHKCQNVSGQYIQNSTIHRSFNRAVTVHGTDNALVKDNVAYDHIGHGYFLEDASEMGNVFDGNLGLLSRIPPKNANGIREGVEPHDIVIRNNVHLSPATFWITNNSNTFINNVAAGSEGTGFWYISPEYDFDGRRSFSLFDLKVDSFENNVAHSCKALGVAFNGDMDADKTVEPLNTTKSDPPSPHFKDNVVYKCEGNGLWTLTRAAIYENWTFADNGAATFHVFFQTFKDCLFVGRSDNLGTLGSEEDVALGYNNPDDLVINKEARFNAFAFYDGPLGLEDCHFDNFPDESTQLMTILGAAVVSPSNYAQNTTFGLNVSQDEKLTYLTTSRDGKRGTNHEDNVFSTVFNDLDGNYTGNAGSYSIKLAPPNTYYPYDPDFFAEPNAQVIPAWDAYHNPTAEFAVIEAKGVIPAAVDSDQFVSRRLNGQYNTTSMENSSHANANHWKFPVIMNIPAGNASKYTYSFQNVEVPEKWQGLRLTSAGYNAANKEYVDVEFVNVPNDVFMDYTPGCPGCPLPVDYTTLGLSALQSQNNNTGYFIDDNSLHIRFVADDPYPQFGDSYRTAQSDGFDVKFTNPNGLAFANANVIPLAEFNTGLDSRGLQGTNGDLPLTGISGHPNGFNYFYVHKDADNVAEHTDYFLQFDSQVWTPFPNLNIKIATFAAAQVFIRDGTTYHYLGTANHGENSFSLSDLSTKLWDVNEIILRFPEANVPDNNNPAVVHLEQFTLGTGLGDADGDGINDQEEKLACRNPNDAADLEFDFDREDLGWNKFNIAAEDFGSREYWYFRVDPSNGTALDAQVAKHNLDFSGDDFSKIYIRFKSQRAQTVDFFWRTVASPTFTAGKSRNFNYTTPDEWVIAEFDMTGDPDWVGQTIRSLRFDPPSSGTEAVHTSIDFIRSEQAEQIWVYQPAGALCLGEQIQFNATLINPVGDEVFQWQFYKDGNWQDVTGGAGANTRFYAIDPAYGDLPYRIRFSSAGCERYSTPIEATLMDIPDIELAEKTGCQASTEYLTLESNPLGGTFTTNAMIGNPVYINVGGPSMTTNGINWQADNYALNGNLYSYGNNAIANSTFDAIYRTERWMSGDLQFEVPIANGDYLVLLHFSENWPTAFSSGVRTFDIELEGNVVDGNYDIYDTVGQLTADIKPYKVKVTDGVLDIDLIKGIENPKLNAISILPRSLSTANLVLGEHDIDFEYIDEPTGCTYYASTSIEVLSPPSQPTVSPDQAFCEDDNEVLLSALPAGGVWTGNGVIGTALYINAGETSTSLIQGGIEWQADDYFSASSIGNYNGFIHYTASKDMYRTDRYSGNNLLYNIPLPAGTYEVQLFFAETWPVAHSPGVRTFDIQLEGNIVATDFDIFKESGANNALVKTYTVNTSDGTLNIGLLKKIQNPKINGIAILPLSFDPVDAGPGIHDLTYTYTDPLTGCSSENTTTMSVNSSPAVSPVVPSAVCEDDGLISLSAYPSFGNWTGNGIAPIININSGGSGFGQGGLSWQADQSFANGAVSDFGNVAIANTVMPSIYTTERWGANNIQYDIPVIPGEYQVQIHFAELHPPAQVVGKRVFNITLEGVLAEGAVDIYNEVGNETALIKNYTITVADNNLDVNFYRTTASLFGPKVSAIRVLPLSFDPAAAGTGTHALIYSYMYPETGCSDASEATITVNSNPTANAGNNLSICAGDGAQTLTASGGTSYLWSTGATTASISVNPTTTTTYNVTATNANGCTDVDQVTVTVNALPTANAGSNLSICAGDGAQTLTASGGANYLWSTGATTASISVNPTATTSYSVTATNANGCTDVDQVIVTVNSLPSLDLGSDIVQCEGDGNITLDAGNSGANYLWNTGETTRFITIADAVLAQTNISVAVDLNDCVVNDDINVSIEAVITPNFTQLGPYCTGDPGDELAGTSLEGINGTWNTSLIDTNVPGLFTYVFTPDANICASTSTMTIEVADCCPAVMQISDVPVPSGLYQTGQWIKSDGQVYAGSAVDYATGQYIELQIGFGVLLGADFSATINPCGGAIPLQGSGETEIKEEK